MKNEREESKTELICETDAYVFQTKSSVLNVSANEEGKALLELDRTVFFPEGGGQRADEGWLGGFKVIDVKQLDSEINNISKEEYNAKFTDINGVRKNIEYDYQTSIFKRCGE